MTQVSGLTQQSATAELDSIVEVEVDPGGSPSSGYHTVEEIIRGFINATELSAQPADTDELVISDAGVLKRIDYSNLVPDSSATVKGKVELATAAETTTGTDTGRAVTPDGLAGSVFGQKAVQLEPFSFVDGTTVATGDGAYFFRVPSVLNGMNLVGIEGAVQTAGTTGTTDVQIHNVTDTVDMLSTKLTIDSGETDSSTAATAAVINTSNDDVATGDILRVDVDAVSTTPPEGLKIDLIFQLP